MVSFNRFEDSGVLFDGWSEIQGVQKNNYIILFKKPAMLNKFSICILIKVDVATRPEFFFISLQNELLFSFVYGAGSFRGCYIVGTG